MLHSTRRDASRSPVNADWKDHIDALSRFNRWEAERLRRRPIDFAAAETWLSEAWEIADPLRAARGCGPTTRTTPPRDSSGPARVGAGAFPSMTRLEYLWPRVEELSAGLERPSIVQQFSRALEKGADLHERRSGDG
jgi:hypothetical protein